MVVRKAAVFRTMILLCAVTLCVGVGACRKSKKIAVSAPKADVTQPAADVAEGGSALPTGLPHVAPPPPSVTPDSPDDKLAEHFGISIDELKRLRNEHATFPSIRLPAGASDKALKPEGVPDRMVQTALSGFKVITAPEISGIDSITTAQIREAALAARQLAFALKVPVFTRPIVFLDYHLDDPKGRMSVVVGLPVPDDIKIPKGVHPRVVRQGNAGFVGHVDVKPLDMAPDAMNFIKRQVAVLAAGGTCNGSLMVILDDWPEGTPKAPAEPLPAGAPVPEPARPAGNLFLVCL